MSKPWDQDYGPEKGQAPWDREYSAPEEAKKKPGYGARAALSDLGVVAAQSTANLVGATGALVDSATGGRVSRALAPAESMVRRMLGADSTPRGLTASADEVSQALQPRKNERMQQSEQELAETKGFFPSAAKVLTDPVLLLGQVGQQIPILAATALGARAGSRAGAAQAESRVAERLAEGVKKPASAAAVERYTAQGAQRGAENAVLGTTSAMGGGFSAQQAVQDVMAMPDDVIGADPEYQKLIASGMSPAEARQERAYSAGLTAAPVGAGVNLLAGRLTAGLEARAFTGAVPNGGIGGLLSAQGLRRVVGAVGREGLEEGITEGAETFGGNLGVAQVDPTQNLMEGVPEASGAAAVMGGVMGGGIQTAGTLASPSQRSNAPAQGESAAADALRAPVPTQQQEVVDIDPAAGPLSRAVATEAAIQTGSPTVEPVRVTTPIARAADVDAAEQAGKAKPSTPVVKESLATETATAEQSSAVARAAPAGMDPKTGEIAAPANDAQIRAALQQRAGTIIDAQQVRAIAASLSVPVQRVSEARRVMREQERQNAAPAAPTKEKSANENEQSSRNGIGVNGRTASASDPQKQAPGQEKGQQQESQEKSAAGQAAGGREALGQGNEKGAPRQEARQHEGADAAGARGRRVLDETPEQQDGDILPPSGSPFSIRAAADLMAKRYPDAKVIELEDGGFVIRTPKEIPLANSNSDAQVPGNRAVDDGRVGEVSGRNAGSIVVREGDGVAEARAVAGNGNSGIVEAAPAGGAETAAAGASTDWTRSLKAARAEAVAAGVDWKGKGLSKLVGEVKAARGANSAAAAAPAPPTATEGRGHSAALRELDAKNRAAGLSDYGLKAVVKKDDGIAALRREAGLTVKAATAAWQEIERDGLKQGLVARPRMVDAISRARGAGEQAAAGAKSAPPRAGQSSAAAPDAGPNAQQSPSAPASETAAGQGSEGGDRSSGASAVDNPVKGSPRNGEQSVNNGDISGKNTQEQIKSDFSENLAAIKREGFKKGDEVEFTNPGPFTNADGTVDQERVYRGTIGNLGDKEQAVVRVDVPGTRGVADWYVPARKLRRPAAVDRAPPRAGKNTIFTAEAADAARKRLKSKLTQANSGIDPEMIQDGIALAGYHIEKGARTFAAYGRAMVADLGDVVKPYLKSWYMGVKYDPRAAAFDGMDSAAAVEAADVDALQDQRSNPAGREAVDAAEDPQAEIARLRAQNDALQAQVDTDTLTGTRSRDAYRRDNPKAKGVAFIDLIAFKGYNTKFTETGGDAILAEFGRIMAEVAGTSAYRRGGDEFALLSDQSPEDAAAMAERLQAAMAKVVIEMTDKNGDAYEVRGIPFRTGVGATDEQAVADSARRKEAGDREDNPNARRKQPNENDVGQAAGRADGREENQPEAVAGESDQAKNYREWLAKNPMPPGMRDIINRDARLNDGEAEAIIAEVEKQQKTQESSNGTNTDPAASAADGEQGAQGAAPGSASAAVGEQRPGELFGPAGESDSGKDRSAGRSKPRAAGARVADRKGAGDSRYPGRSDRAGVGGTAVDGKPGSRNFIVPAGGLTREGSWLESGQRNVEAMALALKLEAEDRLATPEEQAILSRYVGFGSTELANKLFPSAAGDARNYNPAAIQSPAWRALGEKLKATLSSDQLATVMKSTQYAHYTAEPVTRAIWGAVERMGFKGGKVFEPGMGHGAFPMTAPPSIKDAIAYTGVEMDHLTALIGRQLMQGGLVLRANFTKQKMPNDSFDLVIGNPPFSQTVITADPDYRRYRFMLHDYFFAKALDKLRPGGVLAFVTSAGTMNKGSEKARQYMADRADLLGAVRLPDTAFAQNAGTDVVTDVIFLRKRLPGEAPSGESWMGLEEVQARVEDGTENKPVLVNEYFARNSDMVIGEHTLIGSRYSDRKYNVSLRDGESMEQMLDKALQRLPAGSYAPAEVRRDRALAVATAEVDLSPENRKEGGLYVKDGRVMVTRDGAGNELAASEKLSPREERWLIDAVGLRDALKVTLSDQRANVPGWQDSLRALESAYNAFVAKHGPINEFTETERVQRYYLDDVGDEFALKEGQEPPEGYEARERMLVSRRYKNKRLLALDVEAPLLMALEVETDDGRMVGARQLKERSIAPPAEPRIESTTDALLVSLNRKGFLDIAQVAELAGVTQEQAITDLGERIYQNPVDGSWTMADAYLSGDVVTALEEAEAAARTNPAYNRNVDALRAVQPRKLLPRDITVGLGATWVPGPVINDFAKEVLSVNRFNASYDANSGQWKNGSNRSHSERLDGTYSHTSRSASEILDAVLNNRELKVTKTVIAAGGSKSTVTDVEATTAVNEIAKRMRARFAEWVWEDPDRAQDMAATYNTLRNRIIPRTFNGDFIDPPGLAIMFRPDENGRGGLHPHQKRAIWRQVQSGTTYLNHAVGAGKTLEMIIGGMEQKRLGLISKPLYTVPNHVLGQFSAEFLEAYPTANIMVADEESFTGPRRRQFIAQATVNNPDAIIMSHSAFGLLRVKPETMEAVVSDMIDDLRAAIDDTAETDRIGRKRLEQQLESLQQKVESKSDASKKDDVVFFEDIGADYLYVDEAHEFRKLDFVTNRTNVKGITAQGSAKALDLYAKTRHLHRQRPGRSHTFASGTAVTNTMGELYTVQKYMDYDAMRAAGLHHFDAWATEYGEVATEYERNAAGQYRPVERFSKFNNIPELMQQVLERMDVLTSSQLGGLVKRPDVDGGKPQMVVVPASSALTDYMQQHLASRIEKSLKWKPSKEQPHNPDPMLAIIGDARLAVIDMRFVDRTAPNDPNSKLNNMIDAVAQRFHEFADTTFPGLEGAGATQIVFSPIGFGAGVAKSRGFDARAWMLRRLQEQGVPREQVAFMGDYPTNRKRKALFRDMRAGRVRILVGSPANMGTGVNVQNRLRSLHSLSPPWFPSDVEQPHGRIVRQGNLNSLVDLNWYVTEGTYDATGWGMVARKGRFIEQVFQADRSVRSLEDISEVSQYAMASALASGDDRAIRVAELEADLGRLNNLWGDHQKGTSGARNNLFYAKNTADSMVKKLAAAESAVAVVGDTKITADSFTLTLKGKPVPGNSRTEIALAYSGKLRQSIPGAARLAVMNGFEEEIGRVQGEYPLIVSARPGAGDKVYVSMDINIADLRMSVFEDTAFNDLPSSDTGALGLSTRLINAVNSVSELPARYTRELAKAREQVEQAERRAAAPFPQERELFEKQAELAQLQRDMAQETAPTAAIADAEAAEAAPVAALSRPEPARARDSTRFVVGPVDLERRVARVMKNWRGDIPTVRVVESAGKLPKEARREDGWEQAEGWYDGRSTIYLVANNLANLSRADQVLAHEAFGHYGVEGVVGKDQWAGIIADVAKLRAKPEAMRADMRAALASAERRYGTQNDAVFAREFLAVMAERGVASSLLGRVLAAARRWARALGFKVDAWGSAEVREIVARGMRQVRDSGGPRPGSGRGAALSVPEGGAFSIKDSNPDSFMASLSDRFKEPGDGLLDRLKGKLEDWKPATLGLLTLRQLAEVASRYLPSGDTYVDLMTRMATRRNELTNEGAAIAQRWEKMQRADRRTSTTAQKAARTTASDRTVDLMHDATLAGTDPAEDYKIGVLRLQHNGEAVSLDEATATAAIDAIEKKLGDRAWAKEAPDAIKNTMRGDIARLRAGIKTEQGRAAAYPDLVKRYAALPEAWQGLYRDVRDAYLRRSEQTMDAQTMDAMLGRIEGMEIADREKKALRERVRAHFESARIEGPYFPLARFGEFWASVEKEGADGEKERQFIMAETQRDRDRMVKQAEAEGWALAKKGRKIENVRAQDGASGAFVADVINTLGVAGVGEKVQDEVYQLYLRTLPDLSTRKQFIHRKKVAGYDADALRAFAGQMNHGAHQLARLEYGQQLGDALIAIENQAKALQDTADDDADRASAAAGEFKKRHEWVMNPTGAAWVQKVSALNFVFYLGVSPAAAAVNLTQTAIISYPALAARYGAGKAMGAINEAMLASMRTRGGNLDKALKTDDERRAYRQLVDMGAIDVTQAHDLAGLGDNPTQNYNARLHRAMNAVSFLFHKAEVFNREATGLAAYRLARGAGESHDAALKRASDTIWQTHYDYSNANRARFMQGNAAKILFAFKQYSQNTTYYLWRSFYESYYQSIKETFGGTATFSKEDRRIARNRLNGTLGMTALFSGALGLPLVSMMFGTANLMAALFGDDDEPWDAETEFRNFLADMLPPDIARIVSGGLVEGGLEAAGLPAPEIGSRTSLNDLWFRAPNQEMEGRDLWHYILEQVAGPVGGMFGGAISGASLIGEGMATGNYAHVWRGFESMIPKAARDFMKFLRYETQGVNTLRGDPLIEDAGVSAGIFQLLGFSPAEVSEQYELNSAVLGYDDAISSRKKVLLDAYALTYTERDVEGIRAASAKIRDFNRAHPGAAITTKTLRRSMQSRQKFSERAMNGIAVSPKLRGELSQRLRFVFEDDGSEAE